MLQLRADPNALAPERLLVFELTGSVQKFERAVALVNGLEFLGAEDLDEDNEDKNPVVYLMVPTEGALRDVVRLWRDWQRTNDVPPGYSTWKALLSQLRDIRPWGPQDRIAPSDFDVLTSEADSGRPTIRIEVELVFRRDGTATEKIAREAVVAVGGTTISRSRIEGAGYHALLADIPVQALRSALDREQQSIVGSEAVLQIRPQSLLQLEPVEEAGSGSADATPGVNGDPIAAIFDAVPLSAHPRLAGTLTVDDPFDLDGLAVGPRKHGTAMASAVVHGDLHSAWDRPLERPVYFLNMLYATADVNQRERFPDSLPADLFEQALVRMREGDEPSAPQVVVINASLGDANKPFANRISGWARVVDYLASKYGVLFIISAGNHEGFLETENVTALEFEALDDAQKIRSALRASSSQIATRRILAPAESINAITVGSLHADNFEYPYSLPAYTFDLWAGTGLCNISSALGPGYSGATKPDILVPGGRHLVRLAPASTHHRLHPLTKNAGHFGGIGVAAPPSATSLSLDGLGRSVGTSVAAALATGVAARAHEALEAVYPDFGSLPLAQRACLLKALLVHGSRWTAARDLLVEVLGPVGKGVSYRQKDNVRRYLGFGAFDPVMIVNCADDRATLWGVGQLRSDQGHRFRIPWPDAMSRKAKAHGLSATLAWFSPPRPGAVAYRAVRMKIVEPSHLGTAGLESVKVQPDARQAHKGTVVHRRWDGRRAAAIASGGFFDLDVQREPDDSEGPANFALVVTLEMMGEVEVYEQVLTRVSIKPLVGVPA